MVDKDHITLKNCLQSDSFGHTNVIITFIRFPKPAARTVMKGVEFFVADTGCGGGGVYDI